MSAINQESIFGTGDWTVSTLGHFVSLLVDSRDVVVMYRQVASLESEYGGAYPETLTIVLLPDGHVKRALRVCPDSARVHKVLKDLLESGVVE